MVDLTDSSVSLLLVLQAMEYMMEQGKTVYGNLVQSVDFEEPHFRCALIWVAFNPIFWNIVARLEYNTHFLTKIAGSARKGCYILAVIIFSLGIGRDYIFESALRLQESSPFLQNAYFTYLGYGCIAVGQLYVLTSMYQLGITGTYLGDYFGILMNERVTSFPFNVSNNPMYQGSTLSFLGTALILAKPAGLIVAIAVQIMYTIALKFEEPFTVKIYANRDMKKE